MDSSDRQSRNDYVSALNPDPRRGRAQFSPHRVLPPLGGGLKVEAQPRYFECNPASSIEQRLPYTTYLPSKPLCFRRLDLLELRKRVSHEMRDFDISRLKDVYTTLAGFDPHLRGYVKFEHLQKELLEKYNVRRQKEFNLRWYGCSSVFACVFCSPN